MAATESTLLVAYPCLVCKNEMHTTFSLPHQKLHDVSVLPELHGNNTFVETPQGWIFIADISQGSASLLQPQTDSRVELPPLVDVDLPELCKCVLSGNDGSAPGCGVLVLDQTSPTMLFCRVGGGRWSKHCYDIGCYDLPESYCPIPKKRIICNIASLDGRFFFFHSGPNSPVGTLDFIDEDGPEPPEARLGTIAVPSIDVFGNLGENNCAVAMAHLLESGGDLYYVTIAFIGLDDFGKPGMIRVHKMDFSASTWQRIDDIGDHAFLLGSPNFGASCSASNHGLKANRLYWTNAFKQDEELRVYHLKDGSLEEVIDMFGDRSDTPKKPCWIVPAAN